MAKRTVVPLDGNAAGGKYMAFAAKVLKTILWDNVLFLVQGKRVLLKTIVNWIGTNDKGIVSTSLSTLFGLNLAGTKYAPYGAGEFRMTRYYSVFGGHNNTFTLNNMKTQVLPRSSEIGYGTPVSTASDCFSPDMTQVAFFQTPWFVSPVADIWYERFTHNKTTREFAVGEFGKYALSLYELGQGTDSGVHYSPLGDALAIQSQRPDRTLRTHGNLTAIYGKVMMFPSKGGVTGIVTPYAAVPAGFYKASILITNASYEDWYYLNGFNLLTTHWEVFFGDKFVRHQAIGFGTTPLPPAVAEALVRYYFLEEYSNTLNSGIPYDFPIGLQTKVLTLGGEVETVDSLGTVRTSVEADTDQFTPWATPVAMLHSAAVNHYTIEPPMVLTDIPSVSAWIHSVAGTDANGVVMCASLAYSTLDILQVYFSGATAYSIALVQYKFYFRVVVGRPGNMQAVIDVVHTAPQELVGSDTPQGPQNYVTSQQVRPDVKFLGSGAAGAFFSYYCPAPTWLGLVRGVVTGAGTVTPDLLASRLTHNGCFVLGPMAGQYGHLSFDTGTVTAVDAIPFGDSAVGKKFTLFIDEPPTNPVQVWRDGVFSNIALEPSEYPGHPEISFARVLLVTADTVFVEYAAFSKVITRAKYNCETMEGSFYHVRGSWHTDQNGVVGEDESLTSGV